MNHKINQSTNALSSSEKIGLIRDKCIAANPEIVELKFGYWVRRGSYDEYGPYQVLGEIGIEPNIAKEEAAEEYKALAGEEKYEAAREKNDAKKIIQSKREQANQEAKNVSGGEHSNQEV